MQQHQKNSDGSWRETPEAEKINLDPMAGMDFDSTPAAEDAEYESADAGNAENEKIELAAMFDANVDEPGDGLADENEEKEK